MIKTPVAPSIAIAADKNAICQGTAVTFTATPTNGGTTPAYQWKVNGVNAGSNSATYSSTALANGDVVSCTMTSNAMCALPPTGTSNAVTMVVNPLPIINMGPDKIIDKGSSVQLAPFITGNIQTYKWQPPASLSNDAIYNPVAYPQATTQYSLNVISTENCEASNTLTVRVLVPVKVPNVFSPNGDGINDVWQITGLAEYPGSMVDVFNRYGQLIFHSDGYSKPWDGTCNGRPVPMGEYYYIINMGREAEKRTGGIKVFR